MAVPTIFTRFLKVLGVPHTVEYSDAQFRSMTFNSLYGFSHLLGQYGVETTGLKVIDKEHLKELPRPFLAQTITGCFVIVNALDNDTDTLTYDSKGAMLTVPLAEFLKVWNGIALLAYPSESATEPEYGPHRASEIVSQLAHYLLVGSALGLLLYLFVRNSLYAHASTILLAILNGAGLYFAYLLVQKSLNIHTEASDHVCKVLERGGCDSIISLKVSRLFGVFSWSVVGFGYFATSLMALLFFPETWPTLALFNLCCLPYTAWSIWYQKYKAKHWCTLCVGVQLTQWLLFFTYAGGGWLARAWPIPHNFLPMLAAYLFAVLLLNRLLDFFKQLPCHEDIRR